MADGPIIRGFGGTRPRIHESVWVAPGAVVVGDVEIGAGSSVFYGSVIRGDVHRIRIGEQSNIQDHVTLHVSKGRFGATLGDRVTVAHRAVVHGCEVEDEALIGIGAIVMDGARVGAGALVAAGAVVTPGSDVPAGMLAMGIPARAVRELSADERRDQVARALVYVETARAHAAEDALSSAERGSQ